MAQVSSSRARSAEIRRKARSQLLRLREERLQKRSAGVMNHEAPFVEQQEEPLDALQSAACQEHLDDPAEPIDTETAESTATTDGAEQVAIVPNELTDQESHENPQADAVLSADMGPADALSCHNGDDVEHPTEDSADSDPSDTEPMDEPETSATKELAKDTGRMKSDLKKLPGVGPGLIWMLHNCGVQDLKTLSTSDSEELSKGLGIVGQILDVPQLIDASKSLLADRH